MPNGLGGISGTVYYNLPHPTPVPTNVETGTGTLGFLEQTFMGVPIWMLIAGGALILFLFMGRK